MAISGILRLLKQSSSASACRFYSSMSNKRGIVLGVQTNKDKKDSYELTSYAQRYDKSIDGKLSEYLKISGPPKANGSRIFWGLGSKHEAVAIVGITDPASISPLEDYNVKNETVRCAAAVGAKSLVAENIVNIDIESFNDAENAAVGAFLGTFKYDGLKSKAKDTPKPNINFAESDNSDLINSWDRGKVLAESQNFTRVLMETPGNLMTPTIFAEEVKKHFSNSKVQVQAHDADWARKLGMNAFLSVSSGSDQPPVFLELTYTNANANDKCICLVGKGVTFDAGGISIKPAANMKDMRADMGGAANVVGVMSAISRLNMPVNVKTLIPLTENLINGHATKPGDVVVAMNGKSICVDNTDAEGRLILADALCYAERFSPKFVLDIATLTGAIVVALGNCVTAAFCNNEELWKKLHDAGYNSGDRMWRMPLFSHYTKQLSDNEGFDLNNISKKPGGGSCTAAAFLKEFVPKDTPWVHVDMAGVMSPCDDQLYTNGKVYPGRPMRTLVELIAQHASKK